MLNRSSRFAALFAVVAVVGLAACASRRPAPTFSNQSPADPKAPSAPLTRVEPLADPAGSARAGAKPAPSPAPAQTTEVTYVCPMHAQVKSDRPGSCPICGMSLVKAKSQP